MCVCALSLPWNGINVKDSMVDGKYGRALSVSTPNFNLVGIKIALEEAAIE